MARRPLLLMLVLAWLGDFAVAGELDSLFEAGNRLYEQGRYLEAVQTYSNLVERGYVSSGVLFNLGNANFKAGRLGYAVGHYRLAERLAPRDPDIQANLRFVQTAVAGAPPPSRPVPARWIIRATLNEWAWATSLSFWGLFWILSVRLIRPQSAASLRPWIAPCAGLTLMVAACLAWGSVDRFGTTRAVVIQKEAILRHGPVDESPSLQTLVDGQELIILDQKDPWYQVKGASRGIGWIRRESLWVLPSVVSHK